MGTEYTVECLDCNDSEYANKGSRQVRELAKRWLAVSAALRVEDRLDFVRLEIGNSYELHNTARFMLRHQLHRLELVSEYPNDPREALALERCPRHVLSDALYCLVCGASAEDLAKIPVGA